MVYLCLNWRKQGKDPAVAVIAGVRTTLRNIDDCVIEDSNGLKNDLKVTPRNDSISSSKLLYH